MAAVVTVAVVVRGGRKCVCVWGGCLAAAQRVCVSKGLQPSHGFLGRGVLLRARRMLGADDPAEGHTRGDPEMRQTMCLGIDQRRDDETPILPRPSV